MGALTNALVVVMCINVALFMGEMTLQGINPNIHPSIFKCSEIGLMQSSESSGCLGTNYSLNTNPETAKGNLPDGVTSGGGIASLFFDIFNTIKGWILQIAYFIDIIFAPVLFLTRIFPPSMSAYAFAIGFLWYGITLFLFVNWIKGGDA